MATPLAARFRAELKAVHEALLAIPPELADTPWRKGGWTRKQIVGHLLDSAANNRQRFVRAAIDGSFTGPDYAQAAWVEAHGYAGQSWPTLLRWWETEHEILAAAVDHIAEERMESWRILAYDAILGRGLLHASALASRAARRNVGGSSESRRKKARR